jgi:hypothetical protein
VGILEELKGTLGVLENVLPDFFEGAVNHLSEIRNDTYTVKKKAMTDAAREYFSNETALKLEYDLYNHAKGKILHAINLNNNQQFLSEIVRANAETENIAVLFQLSVKLLEK